MSITKRRRRINDEIWMHYEQAVNTALDTIERLARAILRQHTNLDEFIMGMGVASFTRKDGEESLGMGDRSYLQRLREFIDEWDEVLRLTGHPMRFTADGPKITEW